MSHETRDQPMNTESVSLVEYDPETGIEYDPETGTYYVSPSSDRRTSTTAICAVGEIAGIDPLQMDPVFDGHNLDVLDKVATWQAVDEIDIEGAVTVEIADHRVSFHPDGYLAISPPE